MTSRTKKDYYSSIGRMTWSGHEQFARLRKKGYGQ